MAENARPRFIRTVSGFTALALLGGAGAWYQLEVRADRGPSFDQGGEFLSDLPVAGVDGRPYPYGDATGRPAPARRRRRRPSPTRRTGATTGHRRPADPAAPPADVPDADDGAAGRRPPRLPHRPRPATGTYTYSVSGTEGRHRLRLRSVPGDGELRDPRRPVGARRRPRARRPPVGPARGAGHRPLRRRRRGVHLRGRLDHLRARHPDQPGHLLPAHGAGAVAAGRSGRRRQGASTTDDPHRVVDHHRRRPGGPRRARRAAPPRGWSTSSTTPAGSAEEVDRFRRYWYDPALGTWVRWTERFHGARQLLLTFTYDADYTATLTGFSPG